MNASDIQIEISIELPNTDAHRIIRSQDELQQFISDHGDVNVQYDRQYNVYRVPAFAAGRQQYMAWKAAECRRWGCE